MLIFLETIIVLAVLLYLYKLVFKNVNNHFAIPKPLAVGILIVGFLVLHPPIKALIIVILIVAFIVHLINKNRSQYNDTIKNF